MRVYNLTKSQIFKEAHKMAKKNAKAIGDYMVSLKLALTYYHSMNKSGIDRFNSWMLIGISAKHFFPKHAFLTWKEKRVYLNEKTFSFFGICPSKILNSRDYKALFGFQGVDGVYYDLEKDVWVGINLDKVAEYR